ncbi:MAG TPA: hypothetical protein VJH63_03250 [Candidatus Paceibacterota bacterium]
MKREPFSVLPVGDLNNHPHNPTLELMVKRDGDFLQVRRTRRKMRILHNLSKPKAPPPALP